MRGAAETRASQTGCQAGRSCPAPPPRRTEAPTPLPWFGSESGGLGGLRQEVGSSTPRPLLCCWEGARRLQSQAGCGPDPGSCTISWERGGVALPPEPQLYRLYKWLLVPTSQGWTRSGGGNGDAAPGRRPFVPLPHVAGPLEDAREAVEGKYKGT